MIRPLTTAKQSAAGISLVLLFLLSGCTTIQNRRDLYFPERTDGPYTRMIRHGLKGSTSQESAAPSSRHAGSGKNVIKPKG